jgi:DNA polymerase III gamma/tau subunit
MFRDIYVAQSSTNVGEDLMCDETSAQRYYSIAKSVSAGAVLKCLEIFSTLENDLRYATRPEIWLELAVAKACRIQKDESYEALLARIERLEGQIEQGTITNASVVLDKTSKEQEEFFPVKDEDFKPKQVKKKQSLNKEEADNKNTEEIIEDSIEEENIINIEQETRQGAPEEGDDGVVAKTKNDIKEGKRIWSQATEEIKNQKKMRLHSPMKKAKVIGYDGQTITIGYEEVDNICKKKIQDKEHIGILKDTLKKISGKNILVSIGDITRNEEEKKLVDEAFDLFPKGLVSIEHED